MASKPFGDTVTVTASPKTLTALLGLSKPTTFATAALRAGDLTEQASRIYVELAGPARKVGYLNPGDAMSIDLPGALYTDFVLLSGAVGGEKVYCFLVEY